MKSSAPSRASSKNSSAQPVAICLLQTHSVIVALVEHASDGTYAVTYANHTPVRAVAGSSSDHSRAATARACVRGFEQCLQETRIVPSYVYAYTGETLSTTVYRHHILERKKPFGVNDKFVRDLVEKDTRLVEKKIFSQFIDPHLVTDPIWVDMAVNGYRTHALAPVDAAYRFEGTLAHTVVPVHIVEMIVRSIRDVYNRDIETTFHGISGHRIRELIKKLNGSWMYVHVGQFSSEIIFVRNHHVTQTAHIPVGTLHVMNEISEKLGLSERTINHYLAMIADQRLGVDQEKKFRAALDRAWDRFRGDMQTVMGAWVKQGHSVPQIIYSTDHETLPVDERIFPTEPREIWYGSHEIVFLPCESVLSDPAYLAHRSYYRSLLASITESWN